MFKNNNELSALKIEKRENSRETINNYLEVRPAPEFFEPDDQVEIDMAKNIFGMDYWMNEYEALKATLNLNDKFDKDVINHVANNYKGDINNSWKSALNELVLPNIEADKKDKVEHVINNSFFKESTENNFLKKGKKDENLINERIEQSNAQFVFEKREKPIEKITLIFPPSSVNGVGLENCMVPNGILSIGSFLKEKMPNLQVDVLDGSITSAKEMLEKIKSNSPDLVAISMLAGNSASAEEILKVSKEIGATTVAGNHHAKYLENELREGNIDGVDNVDYLIEGRRGEFSFAELIESINKDGDGIKEVKSLVCAQKGNLLFNKNRAERDYPKMPELSDPDLSLISDFEPYFDVYNKVFDKFHPGEYIKQVNVNYIKGCFQGMKKPCSYCCLKDHKFDFLEPNDYWDRITKLSEKGFNLVFETCNSITSLNKLKKGGGGESYLKRLADAMPEELKDKMKMFVYGRVDEINDETIAYMKKMNVCRMVFGFDSGSSTLNTGIGKMDITPNQNLEVAKKLDEAGIQIYGCYVAGANGESMETIKETERQIIEIMDLKSTAAIEYTSLAPMPGSLSWEIVKDKYHEKYGSKIVVENLSKLWVEVLREKGEISVTWEDIEESKQRLKAEADKRGIVFGGYY